MEYTEEQLKNPKWWDKNAPEGAEALIIGELEHFWQKWDGGIELVSIGDGEWLKCSMQAPLNYYRESSYWTVRERPDVDYQDRESDKQKSARQTLLDVANRKLAAKSILENHTIGYSEELDLFHVYVEINNIPMEKSLAGLDGDYIDETALVADVDELANTLISFADAALLEIIYSN